MFIMDVPYIPAQETPIVLAQAATSGAAATPQPDFILKECQETTSTGDPMSAFRAVDPAGMLGIFLQNKYNRPIEFSAIKNITLLQGTTHGKLFAEVDNEGLISYHYDPIPNFVGNDRAVFMAEFEGKRYKIVVNLVVSLTVGESPLMEGEQPVCPPPKLIKVNGKPVSGSSVYDLNVISVNITDLPAGALGQTTGSSITLDDNAAGHNWYIDTTPADNSEFLPTSSKQRGQPDPIDFICCDN